MSLLSKILARRRDRRPPKRSADHIPRGIATDRDLAWDGPSLGPDVIPAIPRSPIDYTFNTRRQVWQPLPRPVSPILPIQANPQQQQPQDQPPSTHPYQSSAGDVARTVQSPQAKSFAEAAAASSTALPPPLSVNAQQALHDNQESPLQWPLTPNRAIDPQPEPSRTPSPLSSQDSLDDMGTLPIEGPAASTVSPIAGSSSAGSESSTDDPLLGRQVYSGGEQQADQEHYFESSNPQPRMRALQAHPTQAYSQQPLVYLDQVEYFPDEADSYYVDEEDQCESQGLGQFSHYNSQQPCHRATPEPSALLLFDEDEEKEDEDDKTNDQNPKVDADDLYEDDTVSDLSSFSATAAAFPVATSAIGVAITAGESITTTATKNSNNQTNTTALAATNAITATTTTTTSTSSNTPMRAPLRLSMRQYLNERPNSAKTSPQPSVTQHQEGPRLTSTSYHSRGSSNVVDFASRSLGPRHRALMDNDMRGRTSWVSSNSSYYGHAEHEDSTDRRGLAGAGVGVPYFQT